MEGFRFSTEIVVRFAETDAQGIAHHASCLVWREVARNGEPIATLACNCQRVLRDLQCFLVPTLVPS